MPGARFLGSATDLAQCPADDFDEVCFVGRSNAGKSTLINAMARAEIARVSKRPGATRTLNFYDFGFFRAVDCPGYGYARVGKGERTLLGDLIGAYLATRPNLRAVVHVVSADVITDDDRWVSAFVRAQTPAKYVVAANKVDSLTQSQAAGLAQKIGAYLKVDAARVVCLSARSRRGIGALVQALKEI